jgi:hypothetical protein
MVGRKPGDASVAGSIHCRATLAIATSGCSKMEQAVSAGGGFRAGSAGQRKGAARGALICALFGSAWMYWAVVFSGHPTPLWFSTVTLPAMALTIWAIFRIRKFRHLVRSHEDLQHWVAFRKFLWIDSGIEWGLAGIGTFLLSRFGRFDLIPQLFGVIIGLRFLPLAKIFRLPHYYWVSGILIVGALGSLLIPRGDIRNIAGCVCIGLTLWVMGVVILWRLCSATELQAAPAS